MRFSSCILFFSLLIGCSFAPNPAPVEERRQPPPAATEMHVVEPGDTLYSIAWRYGLDYRRLAAANKIAPPYIIRRGQRLRIAESDWQPVVQKTNKPTSRTAPAPVPKIIVKQEIPRHDPLPKKGNPEWQWPVNGKVVHGFSTTGTVNKGIDIKGKLQEPVKSAATGRVVYSGSGIRGYGNLVIVKHNDEFLSAYAHNHRILVEESTAVKAGQVIAEMGRDASGVAKLHFEIRRNGKPVNPLKYLPPR